MCCSSVAVIILSNIVLEVLSPHTMAIGVDMEPVGKGSVNEELV